MPATRDIELEAETRVVAACRHYAELAEHIPEGRRPDIRRGRVEAEVLERRDGYVPGEIDHCRLVVYDDLLGHEIDIHDFADERIR